MTLVADVGKAVRSEAAKGAAGTSPLIFVTSAWGWMSEELRGVALLRYAVLVVVLLTAEVKNGT